MLKAKLYFGAVLLSLVALLVGACARPSPAPAPIKQVSREESRRIAEEFVRNSPTFIFEFESRHAGYGDRTGQMLAQVITPHKASIGVEQGEIRSAVLDKKWDMINQKML